MLTFPEETVLVLLDDEEGVFLPIGKNTLDLALTGSVLMELAFADRLDTDLERMMIVNRAPTGDPLFDRILERIVRSDETTNTKAWIETLAVENTAAIQEHALAKLVARGVFRREEKSLFQETVKHLWVFRSPRYFLIDGEAKEETRKRFADALFSDAIPDPRDIALICLVNACGILSALFTEEEIEKSASRIEKLRKLDLIGREIASAIADIERSTMQAMAHPLS